MTGGFVNRRGRRMNPIVRRRVVAVLADRANDGLTQAQLAKEAGMSARTLRDYLTPEVLAEVRAKRERVLALSDLHEVDRAMLEKARAGSVHAAALIYKRVAGMVVEDEEVPTLEELELEIQKLRATRS